jgi:hypothetical protein
MRFLRMLTNAAAAGAFGAALVTILVLQLNPHLPLDPAVVLPLFARLSAFYGINLAVLCYAVFVAWHAAAREPLSPGWLSVRLLAWSGAPIAAWVATLMWLNVRGFLVVVDAAAGRRMAAGAAVTSVCALLLLVVAAVHYSFGRRGSKVGGGMFALAVTASLVLPLAARGRGHAPAAPDPDRPLRPPILPAESSGRLHLVWLDGASLDFIAPIVAEGRLPTFGRILDGGASLHLTTIRPTQPGPVWAAAATGKYPPRNGIRSGERYGFGAGPAAVELLPDLCLAHALVTLGILDRRPLEAGAFRARPFWHVLGDAGVPAGIVGVPLTHPAPPIDGYVVSDRLHLAREGRFPVPLERLVHPPEALALVPEQATNGSASRDAWYREYARRLEARWPPRVSLIRYEGLDRAGHHYLRYAMPAAFGDVSVEERQRFGQLLEGAYAEVDEELASIIERLGPDDLLLVVSGFGMAPVSPGKRILAWLLREPALSGSHEGAPDGFLLAYGRMVRPGRLPVGAIVDVAPTVLYFLGLPVARDMDGSARTDLFAPVFTADRPVIFVPTYDR